MQGIFSVVGYRPMCYVLNWLKYKLFLNKICLVFCKPILNPGIFGREVSAIYMLAIQCVYMYTNKHTVILAICIKCIDEGFKFTKLKKQTKWIKIS